MLDRSKCLYTLLGLGGGRCVWFELWLVGLGCRIGFRIRVRVWLRVRVSVRPSVRVSFSIIRPRRSL